MRMQGLSTLSRVDSARTAWDAWTREGPKFPGEKAQPELGEKMHVRVQSTSSRAFLQSNNQNRKISP